MKIVITGATSFIGRALVRKWRDVHEVIALSRRDPAIEGICWTKVDLTEKISATSLPNSADVLVHLAQSRNYRNFPAEAADIFAVNVRSTMDLLDHAWKTGVKHFVLASTGGLYAPSAGTLSENNAIAPSNFYLSSKYLAELLVSSYSSFFRVTTVRLFSPYGLEQSPQMMIPRLFNQIQHDEPVRIQGNPGLRINPVFIDDVARAMTAILDKPSKPIINIAGKENVDLTQLVQIIGQVLGRKPRIEYESPGAPQVSLIGNIQLLRDELGIEPQVSLREGLSRLM